MLLAHPGGPFWAARDAGAWTIPKGEVEPGESLEDAARREFTEETGFVPSGPLLPLGSVQQRGGKVVHGWAVEGDADPAALRCVTTEFEWPPRSGRFITIPEIDRAGWFSLGEGRIKINPAQVAFLERLSVAVGLA